MPIPFTLTTPLPEADLRFDAMQHSAGVSMLEDTRLFLLSDRSDIAPDDLLGQTVDVQLALRGGDVRHVCGHVTRFGQGRHQGRYFGYLAEVRPWLWFLTRSSDCRIFQMTSVPDIVQRVFADYGDIAVFEFRLNRSHRVREYCVQYRETDFNFVARLLEDEGIYWYFEHAAGEHKLVLVDAGGSLSSAPQAASLPFFDNTEQRSPDIDIVTDWQFGRQVRSGKVALRSYHFETPSTSLEVTRTEKRAHDQSGYELYDYQGDYFKKTDGDQIAGVRLDEAQSGHEEITARTNAIGLANGRLFSLVKHPRDDQNAEYFVIQTQIDASVNRLESGNDTGDYACHFTALPSGQVYRPPRRTPKPFVQGPQSAVVTGPAGEEIFTDRYGRVKVQFHWDRLGKRDENTSCWMRVSHPWAGKSFGAVHIPRIGQEVIVDFLEGDPDQPLITGRVYNAENMPPWDLPANATQSGILTRSSKGGAYGNANALRFEDKKGSEQVWLHAEKNQDIEVENDETHWVGHDRTKTIDHDETEHVRHDRRKTIDNDETVHVHHDRTETVDHNEKISIGVNRTEDVGRNETISIGVDRTESVGQDETLSIGRHRRMDVGQDESLAVGRHRTHTVDQNETVRIGENWTVTVGKDASVDVQGLRRTKVAKDDSLHVGKKLSIEAVDEIVLKTGAASITLKKDGTIAIKGKDISVDASGKIAMKASGQMTLKGSKIAEN
jgi:type VI secretion system secreted protein VgrG